MADFPLPTVPNNPDGWGPPQSGDMCEYEGLDFNVEHLDKFPVARVGRICDFTVSGQRFVEQRLAKGKGKGKGQPLTPTPGKDEEGFALVDNRPAQGKSQGRGRGFKGKGKGKGKDVNYQEGILGQKQKLIYPINNNVKGKGKSKNKGGGMQRRGMPSYKEWSVTTKTHWEIKRELALNQLAKLQIDAREVTREDIMWCGRLDSYNKEFDQLTVRTQKSMPRYEELNFYNVTASDDPWLPEILQEDPTIEVIATDHVLACIIAAARSVYSWDIVITKISNKLIFDKRDLSQIDFLSVNETAQEPPNNDDKDNINSPIKLGQEATCINQNFSQMVIDPQIASEEMGHPNPFEEEGDARAASGAYRYVKITLPGNPKDDNEFNQRPVCIAVRTHVDCKMPSVRGEAPSLVSVKALNEFDPKPNFSWMTHLESQRGAVLATELKNNGFKLGRWTAQAILAGCDILKVGYASRVRPKDQFTHNVLGVQTYHTDGFAEQIGMTRNNVYGILRNIIDLLMGFEDGKYLMLKDPTKSVVRIYELPWDEFQEEDDGEEKGEEGDEDGQELDDEGNALPKTT